MCVDLLVYLINMCIWCPHMVFVVAIVLLSNGTVVYIYVCLFFLILSFVLQIYYRYIYIIYIYVYLHVSI